MSTQQAAPKPSLTGVRIKARKGAVKAQAKHEPTVFRDQVFKHLEVIPADDFDAVANKLIQAGSTLEYLKYADALFEILLVGGLLQPGGGYLEDGAPLSPFSILRAKEDPVDIGEIRKYAEVFNKLIRRYKYLQKPLEESSIPGLLQYAHRWPDSQREKFACMAGLLLNQGLASASALHVLTKDHLIKDGLALIILTNIFRAYLADQTMEHLSGTLKRGGVKDLLEFFPPNKRTPTVLEAHFKEHGIPIVGEWYAKKRVVAIKDIIVTGLRELVQKEEGVDSLVNFIKEQQADQPIAESELVPFIWHGLMATVDWSTRPDQIEAYALREITNYAPVLEPFCNGPKTEVALINTVQVFCYEESRVMKTFPQILKVLYNKDCISDQAILYWHSKGSKQQGRQHFLKATEPLVNFLKQQEEEESDEE